MDILYSLGTVVKIKDHVAEYTIIGYYPLDENGKKHTYLGVNAITGLSIHANALPFDQEAIEEVVFLGYSEERSEKFRINIGRMFASESENG